MNSLPGMAAAEMDEERFGEIVQAGKAENRGTLTFSEPTELQRRYINGDRHYELVIKPFLDEFREIKKALEAEYGPGVFFQDPSDGTVYKTDTCDGRFVYNETFQVKRTRRAGEEKGSLSMKEAREAGFVVEGK